jgi:hypothetical protein
MVLRLHRSIANQVLGQAVLQACRNLDLTRLKLAASSLEAQSL